jgi:hypothetical protein
MHTGLPHWASILVELSCLGFLLSRLMHERLFSNKNDFWRDKKHLVRASLIGAVLVLQMTSWFFKLGGQF